MLRMSGNIILTLVLLSAVYTVKKQRRTFIAGLILCIPSVVTSWMYLISPMAIHPAVHSAATMVFDGYIIYKPHPDVLAGNRKGHIEESIALKYCNTIIKEASLDSVLELSDEVHTMTSLVGFEALIRGKKVYTYGLPFYAAWGLTVDEKTCARRTVSRTLDELIAAAFILYPRYIDPVTNELCEVEVLLREIDKEKNRYNSDKFYKLRIDGRNMILRKIQLLIKVILGE